MRIFFAFVYLVLGFALMELNKEFEYTLLTIYWVGALLNAVAQLVLYLDELP